jgi:hypothetical protein
MRNGGFLGEVNTVRAEAKPEFAGGVSGELVRRVWGIGTVSNHLLRENPF